MNYSGFRALAEDAEGEQRPKRGDAQREGNPGTVDIIMLCGSERFQAGGYFAALAFSPSLKCMHF